MKHLLLSKLFIALWFLPFIFLALQAESDNEVQVGLVGTDSSVNYQELSLASLNTPYVATGKTHYVTTSLGSELADNQGLFVYTSHENATVCYRVLDNNSLAVTSTLAATHTSGQTFITWTERAGATSYSIRRGTCPQSDSVQVVETNAAPQPVLITQKTATTTDGSIAAKAYTMFMDQDYWNSDIYRGQGYSYGVSLPNWYDGRAMPISVHMEGYGSRYVFVTNTPFNVNMIYISIDDPAYSAASGSAPDYSATQGLGYGWYFGQPCEGRDPSTAGVCNFIEDAILRIINNTKITHNVDSNRIYAYGHSMGGTGALRLGVRYPNVFASIYASEPVTDFATTGDGAGSTSWVSDVADSWGATTTNYAFHPVGTTTLHLSQFDGVRVWDFQNIGKFLCDYRGRSTAILSMAHGTADNTVDTDTQGYPFYVKTNDCRTGYYAVINAFEHQWQGYRGQGENLNQEKNGLYDYSNTRQTFPAFSNNSSSTVPGTIGQSEFNQRLEYSTSDNAKSNFDGNIIDQTSKWQVAIRSTDGTGASVAYGTQTVDVTPRRVTNFTVTTSDIIAWENQQVSNSATIASGTVVVDSYGLITVPNFYVTASGNRLILTRVSVSQAGTPTVSSVSSSSLSVSMNAGTNNASTTFAIYATTTRQFVNASGTLGSSAVYQATSTWGTVGISGLTPNTQYQFAVIARAPQGVNAATSTDSVVTTTYAAIPQSLTATASGTSQITLAWDANNNPTSTVYDLRLTNGTLVATTTATSSVVTGLTPGQTYAYQVRAENTNRSGTYSAYSSSTSTVTSINAAGTPTVSAVSTSSLVLALDTNSNGASTTYAIYSSTTVQFVNASGTLASSAVYQASSTWGNASLTGLIPNTSYQFSVVARRSDGTLATTSTASTATTTYAAIPLSLAASANGQTRIDLTWNANNNPAGTVYDVRYGNGTFIATTTAASYSVLSLTPGVEYTFQVRAENTNRTGTYSSYSTAATVTTGVNIAGEPTVSSVSSSSLVLTFDTNGNSASTTYAIYSSTTAQFVAANGGLAVSAVYQASSTWGTPTVAGLTPNTVYAFAVIARSGSGITAATSTASTATTTYAAIPTNFSATAANSTQINLSWDTNNNPISTVYDIRDQNGTLIATTTATSTSITGLTPGATYQIKVRAENTNRSGTYSSYASTQTVITTGNAAGQPSVGSISTSSLALTINTNSNSASTTYALYSTTVGQFLASAGTVSSASAVFQSASTWGTPTVSGLTPNTLYQFSVIARRSDGTIAATSTDSAATSTLPAIPVSFSGTANGQTRIDLAWTANNNPGTTVYDIRYSNGTLIATTTATSSSVTGLSASTQYTFKVRAADAYRSGSYSSYSDTVSVTTDAVGAPNQAGIPTASAVSTSSLVLTLDANGNDNTVTYAMYSSTLGRYIAADGGLDAASAVYQTNAAWGSLSVIDLTPNTAYAFAVIARNTENVSVATSTALTTTTLAAAPASLVAAAASASSIALSWSANGNPDGTVYDVRYSSGILIATTTETSYTVSSLSASTEYQFKIRAENRNRATYSSYSSVASAATNANSSSGGGGSSGSVTPIPRTVTTTPTSATTTMPQSVSDITNDMLEPAKPLTEIARYARPSTVVRESYAPNEPQAVNFGGGTVHTVTVSHVSPAKITVMIQSDPVTVELVKGETKRIDTDKDTIPDVRAVYVGLDADNKPILELENMTDEKQKKLPVVINGGAFDTTERNVTLAFHVQKATSMAIVNTPDFTHARFVPFAPTTNWMLADGTGEKHVYVYFRLADGGIIAYDDTIEFVTLTNTPLISGFSCAVAMGTPYRAAGETTVYFVSEPHQANGRIDDTVASCRKRAFIRPETYGTYFKSPDDVVVIDRKTLESIPNDGMSFIPRGSRYVPQDGTLVKIPGDSGVYVLLNGRKHKFMSGDILEALGYEWSWVEDVDESVLGRYLIGSDIASKNEHPALTLIRYDDKGTVYRLEPGTGELADRLVKRNIADQDTIRALQYREDRIVSVPSTFRYPDGSPLKLIPSKAPVKTMPPTQSQTTPTPTPDANRLSRGSSGARVLAMQKQLITLGYFPKNVTANANYGPTTEQAVKDFQKAEELSVTGIADSATLSHLQERAAVGTQKTIPTETPVEQIFTVPAPTPVSVPVTEPPVQQIFTPDNTSTDLYPGMQGDAVRVLQEALLKIGFFPRDVKINGVYGPTTQNAVKEFQRAHFIPASGVFDAKTRSVLERY